MPTVSDLKFENITKEEDGRVFPLTFAKEGIEQKISLNNFKTTEYRF